jgi:RNA polymerase sigma factor (sigma-70 family)
MVPDNQHVIDSIRRGDYTILRKIYKETQVEFHQWAFSRYKIPSREAEEIFQTTVIIFYEKVTSADFTLSSQWKTFLFAVGKNKIREYLRAQGKLAKWEEALDTDVHENIALDEESEVDFQAELVIKCIGELGASCKELIMAFYYQKLALEEISPKLGYKNPNSAKNQKFKCMQRLKELFLKHYQGIS